VSSQVFSDYGQYYDLLYSDKDYQGEVEYLASLLKRFGIEKGSLLEFGSGTGKHGCILAKKGFTVYGIEKSPEMVAASNTHQGFSCQIGDIASTVLSRKFDAVISVFHVMSYLVSRDSFLATLENAAKHLVPGGVFVFDFWYSPAVFANKPCIRVKHMKDDRFELIRIAEPKEYLDESRVDVHYTIMTRDLLTQGVRLFEEVHPMKHFTLSEVDVSSSLSGFRRVNAEEFGTGRLPSRDTWGVCVVLERL
jgi:SAM-dependent methyltransferase